MNEPRKVMKLEKYVKQEKVKVMNTPDTKHEGFDAIQYWKDKQGKEDSFNPKCLVSGCDDDAEGAVVQIIGDSSHYYICPLCHKHNKDSDLVLTVMRRYLVPVDKEKVFQD